MKIGLHVFFHEARKFYKSKAIFQIVLYPVLWTLLLVLLLGMLGPYHYEEDTFFRVGIDITEDVQNNPTGIAFQSAFEDAQIITSPANKPYAIKSLNLDAMVSFRVEKEVLSQVVITYDPLSEKSTLVKDFIQKKAQAFLNKGQNAPTLSLREEPYSPPTGISGARERTSFISGNFRLFLAALWFIIFCFLLVFSKRIWGWDVRDGVDSLLRIPYTHHKQVMWAKVSAMGGIIICYVVLCALSVVVARPFWAAHQIELADIATIFVAIFYVLAFLLGCLLLLYWLFEKPNRSPIQKIAFFAGAIICGLFTNLSATQIMRPHIPVQTVSSSIVSELVYAPRMLVADVPLVPLLGDFLPFAPLFVLFPLFIVIAFLLRQIKIKK